MLSGGEREERRKIKMRSYVANYRRRHPERVWDVTHPERAAEIRRNAPSNSKPARAERMRKWRKDNPEKDAATAAKGRSLRLALQKEWRQRNKAKVRANWAAYDALKKQAMPPWADRKEIDKIYADCPDGMEVDHIVPLKGRNVCGLHIAANLQYLTPSANKSKGNRWHP